MADDGFAHSGGGSHPGWRTAPIGPGEGATQKELISRDAVGTGPQKPAARPVPIKVGIFGGQGSGKSTTAALLAAALSKEVYGGAPVMVTDTEAGWPFLKRRIFDVEKVELVQRTEASFKAMLANVRLAEKLGCCVWVVDQLSRIWMELLKTFRGEKKFIAIDQWGDLREVWQDYIENYFLNSPMSTIALGRAGNITEEVEDDRNPEKTRLVNMGTKFKAGGSESFGYEPHLLLELSIERKARRRAGVRMEGEGRMIHRADVLKDRTWALNGQVIRWSDKSGYALRGYAQVWQPIKPHFDEVQAVMEQGTVQAGSSASLVSPNGSSEFHQRRKRRDVLVEELDASMQLLWGGQGQAEKRIRTLVGEALFGVRSKTALAELSLEAVERGVKILQAFERRIKSEGMPTTEPGVLSLLQLDVEAWEQAAAEQAALPF